MSLTIHRVTRDEEARDAARLLALQFREHTISLSNEQVALAIAGLVTVPDRGALLLARESEEAVGVAVLAYIWTLEHGGLVAWLDELYVVPWQRCRGTGR